MNRVYTYLNVILLFSHHHLQDLKNLLGSLSIFELKFFSFQSFNEMKIDRNMIHFILNTLISCSGRFG